MEVRRERKIGDVHSLLKKLAVKWRKERNQTAGSVG